MRDKHCYYSHIITVIKGVTYCMQPIFVEDLLIIIWGRHVLD